MLSCAPNCPMVIDPVSYSRTQGSKINSMKNPIKSPWQFYIRSSFKTVENINLAGGPIQK